MSYNHFFFLNYPTFFYCMLCDLFKSHPKRNKKRIWVYTVHNSTTWKRNKNHLKYSYEKDAHRRDFILGVSEILSGMLCFWLVPPPYKVPLGAFLVEKGFERTWTASNALLTIKDISLMELRKQAISSKNQACKQSF